MTSEERAHVSEMFTELVDLYCDLIKINRRIGIWDMRRHGLCKADVSDIELSYLVKTERLGRISVEKRAACKTHIDNLFAKIIAHSSQVSSYSATKSEG